MSCEQFSLPSALNKKEWMYVNCKTVSTDKLINGALTFPSEAAPNGNYIINANANLLSLAPIVSPEPTYYSAFIEPLRGGYLSNQSLKPSINIMQSQFTYDAPTGRILYTGPSKKFIVSLSSFYSRVPESASDDYSSVIIYNGVSPGEFQPSNYVMFLPNSAGHQIRMGMTVRAYGTINTGDWIGITINIFGQSMGLSIGDQFYESPYMGVLTIQPL